MIEDDLFKEAKRIADDKFRNDYDSFLELAGCTTCPEFKGCGDNKEYIPLCRWRAAVRNAYTVLLKKHDGA